MKSIIEAAKKTIETEASAIKGLTDYIDKDFEQVVGLLMTFKGRFVVSGIGKSAIIGQKIVATFNSTGTPSIFMHAADAIHGDLGMVQEDDVVMIISKSGESPEIKFLVPLIKNMGNPLIGMTGKIPSYLSLQSDYVLNTTVPVEACPNNLAPTSSTTAQLVMGDALAVCLMEQKGFTGEDFAKYHPGGALGKKLYLRVADIYPKGAKPQVILEDGVRKVIVEITRHRLGITAVLGDDGKIEGVITDGDLRRMLEKNGDVDEQMARDIMSLNPKTIEKQSLAVSALEIMRQNNITQLLVTDENSYVGVLHLHELIKEGII
jgi:arabinose-5-phosphate isomerase